MKLTYSISEDEMNYLLGIDIGTSGAKTILLDTDKGRIAASSVREYPLDTPRPLWAQQEPEDWWQAAVGGIGDVLARTGAAPSDIKAVGLTGQMHSSVFLDERDCSIRPAILWCDQRTGDECGQINDLIGKDRIVDITCNPMLTGFTLPKLIWLRNHEPENYAASARCSCPRTTYASGSPGNTPPTCPTLRAWASLT